MVVKVEKPAAEGKAPRARGQSVENDKGRDSRVPSNQHKERNRSSSTSSSSSSSLSSSSSTVVSDVSLHAEQQAGAGTAMEETVPSGGDVVSLNVEHLKLCSDSKIVLNIGGKKFETSKKRLWPCHIVYSKGWWRQQQCRWGLFHR